MLHAYGRMRRWAGLLLALGGVLLIFVCVPTQMLVILAGAALFFFGAELLRMD